MTVEKIDLSPANADLLLLTGRSGVASAVGHDLTLRVADWSGALTLAPAAASSAVEATVDLTSLIVVEGSGGAKPLSDKDRRDIISNAGKALGIAKHPHARFVSTTITGTGDTASIRGDLSVNGHTRAVHVEVRRTQTGFSATATITQTDFGIKPFSAMLGALKVADDVRVSITVTC